MQIKAAKIEDHEILTKVMRASKAIWGYQKEQLEKWREELTISQDYIKENEVFNLWKENEIVGFYSYTKQFNNLKLDNLFVHPECIGKGMGRIMMEDFFERAKSISKERIILEADPNAELYYEKFGFNTIALWETSIPGRFIPIMMKANFNSGKADLFETERLFVRHLKLEDIEGFYDMQSNPEVMRYVKPVMNYEEAKEELERFIGYYEERKKMFRIWAVIEKQTDCFVGICGVYLNQKTETEIAYRLRQKNWGKGYGKEIAEKLIDFCFETLDYEELSAYVMDGNIGSKKILDRFMRFEKEIYSEETSSKEYVYKMGKEYWLQSRGIENGIK